MKRFTPITQFIFTIALLLAVTFNVNAQVGIDNVDTGRQSITFSAAGQNTNSITAITAASPIGLINGHGAIFMSRQTADDKVISEIVNAKVQGGWKYLKGFVEFERDIHRGIEREFKVGYVIPVTAQLGPVTLIAGAGNHTANSAFKRAVGQEKTDDPITVGWTTFLQADWWKTSTTATAEPNIDFKSVQVEIESAIRQKVAPNLELGATVIGQFDSDPPVDGRFHSQYLLFVTWTR